MFLGHYLSNVTNVQDKVTVYLPHIELITCHLYPSVLLLSRVWYFIEMVVKSVRWSRNDCVEVGGPGGRWSLYCILQQLEQLIMIRTGMAVVKVACPD